CRFRGDSAVTLDRGVAQIHLYRIAQEALNNAIKHSKARRIRIGLATQGDHTVLSVEDDGVGLPPKLQKSKGSGLRIMDYRASVLGGSLVVKKRRRGGTALVCAIPKAQPKSSSEGNA